MKKLINDPETCVRESLEGLALAQPGLALLADRLIAVRADRVVTDQNRAEVPVALVSGGGAGHEPAHAGYVAEGMLTAAVSGGVFSSPSVDAVLDGIRAVTGDAGCLLVVKSYTGDRLNFGMAAELARAEGLDVEVVVVADDVALTDSDANAGRRGLAGTVLVHKIAGAAAEEGASLVEVATLAREVSGKLGTMGVGLTPCTVPGASEPGFSLGDDEVELGLGIHGEPGVERVPVQPADGLVAELVSRIVADGGLAADDDVVALINSTGGTPPMELAIVTRAVGAQLAERGIRLAGIVQGPVMTSLEMAGASVTLLPVEDGHFGRWPTLLRARTTALAWPGFADGSAPSTDLPVPATVDHDTASGEPDERVRAAIDRVCAVLLEREEALTALDREVGDGDLGTALARGARAWQQNPVQGSAPYLLRTLSEYARRDIGGTSGPLYAVGLLRCAEEFANGADWPTAFAAGVGAVSELGGARPGDRTMVDALQPAAEAAPQGLRAAAEAAVAGAEGTSQQVARRGRTSYLGERAKGHPDPGAVAVGDWLTALADL